jgi:protein-disulfide isomerase
VLAPLALAAAATATAQDDELLAARTKGRADAPVTIYEMSDFQCPWCARFALETLPLLEREYVATGRARFVYIHFPLSHHRNAVPAAELAMCGARQGRFWQLHDLLFRHQARWQDLEEPGSYFLALGDSAGVDREALVACLRSGATRELIRRDAAAALRSGARSTPAFYIEGGLLAGAQPLGVFRRILDSIIRERTRGPRPRR